MTGPPYLDPARLQQLQGLGMGAAVPSWLPEGFALAGLDIDRDPGYGVSYRLAYRGPGGAELFVEGTDGGLGDVFRGESRARFDNPALGPGTVEFYPPDSEEGMDFRSHWLQSHPEMPAYGVAGRGLEPADAVRVAEGLRFLE